jgi:hypothetical protein
MIAARDLCVNHLIAPGTQRIAESPSGLNENWTGTERTASLERADIHEESNTVSRLCCILPC